MGELADPTDSKSVAEMRHGSSPCRGTLNYYRRTLCQSEQKH